MARSETYKTLLDRCETPMQTYLILAQLEILRRQDKIRNQRGSAEGALLVGIMIYTGAILALMIWASHMGVAGNRILQAIALGL